MTNTKKLNVLISGASVGGPALAYWLARQGHDVTVVERAPAPRPGGQSVDFKGATHRTVLERMGVWDDILARQTGGHDIPIVDRDGRRITTLPGAFTGGDVEIQRGDLAAILYERTADTCAYVFGDSIASLTPTPAGVDVTFERAAARTYDLVIGADGIHSNVRRLAFGPERDYVRHLGYYYALTDIGIDGPVAMYNEPGRMASIGGSKAQVMFVFKSDPIDYDRYDQAEQKRIIAAAFAGGGWRLPELVAALPDARDVYLDSISHVHTDTYHRGRVALLGDAAYGNTLGGFGTGLAIVGAYVLAGELAAADGDHMRAFTGYQERFAPYAKITHGGNNAGSFLAPATRRGIRWRDRMLRSRLLMALMLKFTDRVATDIDLPAYPLPGPIPNP